MGYLKHVYGDDMTPDECARLDHAELMQQIAQQVHYVGGVLIARTLSMYHDRFYGVSKQCAFCLEPQREQDAKKLTGIEAAFKRPSVDPRPVPPKPKPVPCEHAFHVALDQVVFRKVFDNIAGFSIIDPTSEPKDENETL